MSLRMDKDWIPASAGMTNKGKPVPKTGLAEIMREWMKARTGTKVQQRFTLGQICEALCADTPTQRQAVTNAIADFIDRAEVVVYDIPRRRRCPSGCSAPGIVRFGLPDGSHRLTKKHNRRVFYYVHDWHKVLKGNINRKVYKAMYVSQTFAVTDLCRLTGIKERNYFDKIIRQLKKAGQIAQVQRRRCSHGLGAENVYHITNRDRFKLEVMR